MEERGYEGMDYRFSVFGLDVGGEMQYFRGGRTQV